MASNLSMAPTARSAAVEAIAAGNPCSTRRGFGVEDTETDTLQKHDANQSQPGPSRGRSEPIRYQREVVSQDYADLLDNNRPATHFRFQLVQATARDLTSAIPAMHDTA